jgi:hypothetical protein
VNKLKKTFKLWDVVGKTLYDVQGEVLPNDKGLDLFVAKTKGGNYQVAESNTGLLLGGVQRLKRDAVTKAYELLERANIDELKRKINALKQENANG